MHVLIISHGYPTVKDPQWGCFEKDQAEALVGMGHRVTVAVLDMRFRPSNQTFGISHISDGPISAYIYFLLSGKLIPSRMKRFVFERMMLRLCRKIFRAEGIPDVIYAHYMFCMARLRLVKQKYAIPIVGIEHWSELNKTTLPSRLMQMGRTAYTLADRLLAVSPSLQTQMKRHFGVEAEVVYDMVSDAFLQPVIPKKNAKPFVWLAVGSLIQRKGYDVLIEAFAQLDRSALPLGSSKNEEQLIIIGSGTENERLHAQAEQLGIADRVRFTGMLDKQTIVSLMNESNAFVLPSRGETFGVAYIEAMAMGLPVIATPCGGPEHFVNSDNGLLVDIDNVELLTKAMRQMETTIDKYQPETIRAYIQERFSAKAIVGQLEEIFGKVIKQKSNNK
jgi:glycosyltransferase involved in cell wall biosynthesis